METYVFNVVLISYKWVILSTLFFFLAYLVKNKKIRNMIQKSCVVIVFMVSISSAMYAPFTYKNSYDSSQRDYQNSVTSEEMRKRAQGEVTLEGVLEPTVTDEERQDRTDNATSWRD